MWFKKKTEAKIEDKTKIEDQIDPRLKEVEDKYKLGVSYLLLGQKVTVTSYHNTHVYGSPIFRYNIEPGVNVTWWTTNKELEETFVSYPGLQYLTPTRKRTI
jgi:hypothetical protein